MGGDIWGNISREIYRGNYLEGALGEMLCGVTSGESLQHDNKENLPDQHKRSVFLPDKND